MIPIESDYNIDEKSFYNGKMVTYASVLEDYYNKLIPKRSKKLNILDNWCRDNISLNKVTGDKLWSFKDVVCANPDDLIKLKKFLDGLSESVRRNLSIISSYVVTRLYSYRMSKFGAREVLENFLSVKVCPYCNRNWIGVIKKKNEYQTTCELDHFFPKGGNKGLNSDGYPLLAVSFYNLIPVCHYCNVKKGEGILKAFYPYMINWKKTESIKFTYYPTGVNYLYDSNSLDIGIKIVEKEENNKNQSEMDSKNVKETEEDYRQWNQYAVIHDIDMLNLLEIYQNNKNEVQKIIKKKNVFGDDYAKMIFKEYKEYFSSSQEVEYLLQDRIRAEQDIAEIPLGKLRNDIFTEITE